MSPFSDDETAVEGVFVINRYDWRYYDKRSEDEVVETAAEGLGGEALPAPPYYGRFESAGLVYLAAARSIVLRWKDQPSREAQWSEGGAWLHIPGGEYMFGCFGFDDDSAAACSFLFFTTNTVFTRTVFRGLERTLRKEEPKKRGSSSGYEKASTSRDSKHFARVPGVLSLFPPSLPRAEC